MDEQANGERERETEKDEAGRPQTCRTASVLKIRVKSQRCGFKSDVGRAGRLETQTAFLCYSLETQFLFHQEILVSALKPFD